QQLSLVVAEDATIERLQVWRMGLIRLFGQPRRQIGERAPMPLISDDLKAIFCSSREACACGAHRIERQRTDMRGENMLAVADEVKRPHLPIRLGTPAMRRRKNLHTAWRSRQERTNVPVDLTEILGQRGYFGVPAAENETLVGFETGKAWETV